VLFGLRLLCRAEQVKAEREESGAFAVGRLKRLEEMS
jgi:hypothetical protein